MRLATSATLSHLYRITLGHILQKKNEFPFLCGVINIHLSTYVQTGFLIKNNPK